MLPPKGHACFLCREHKVKCNGVKPVCSRCERLNKQCTYAADIARRALIMGTLEARALELELIVHKATLASAHNLSLASSRLFERIKRLGNNHERKSVDSMWLPIYPESQQSALHLQGSIGTGEVLGDDVAEGYSSVILRDIVEYELSSYQWTGLDDLPPSISHYLIRLFLPYRSHYYFFMDVPYFLQCLSLPSSHPESIHPCLLNACYLAACQSSGGALASLQPFFIARTRYFLNQALMHADRITHFIWASVLLACNFGRRLRIDEAYAAVSSAALLASASGRAGMDSLRSESLLPPPKNEAEAIDGIRLAYALYCADHCFAALTIYPRTFHYDDRWASASAQCDILRNGESEVSPTGKQKLEELWGSDFHLKISIVRIVERVTEFAIAYYAKGSLGMEAEYAALESEIRSQQKSIPPLSDPRGLQAGEAVSIFNPHILYAHTSLYGSGLILWGLRAHENVTAKRRILECLHALAAICELIQAHRQLGWVHAHLTSMVPMKMAVQILANQMRNKEVRGNAALSSNYCSILELLLDFLDDMTLRYSEWTVIVMALKDTVAATAKSLAAA